MNQNSINIIGHGDWSRNNDHMINEYQYATEEVTCEGVDFKWDEVKVILSETRTLVRLSCLEKGIWADFVTSIHTQKEWMRVIIHSKEIVLTSELDGYVGDMLEAFDNCIVGVVNEILRLEIWHQ